MNVCGAGVRSSGLTARVLRSQEEEAPAEVGEASEAPQAGVVEGVFSDYVQDDVDELEEGDADKEIPEQQVRDKRSQCRWESARIFFKPRACVVLQRDAWS